MNPGHTRRQPGPARGTRRGMAFVGLSLAVLALLLAGATSFLLTVATRARQSAYERQAVQALYGAEAGIETVLAGLPPGKLPTGAQRGRCGDATWECEVREKGGEVGLVATGAVQGHAGLTVFRRVVVTVRLGPGGLRVTGWRRVPSAVPSPDSPSEPAALQPIGEGSR